MHLLRVVACAGAVVLGAATANAGTVAVGSCQPGHVTFSTIQSAVSSSPTGTTIDVCPGNYAEQVTITKSLTLKGVAAGSGPVSDAANIVVPGGGLAVNASDPDNSNSPIAAQIVVESAGPVTIENLTVNGANNNVQTCGTDVVGILYQGSWGAIDKNNVINQIQPNGFTGCQGGLAIYAQSGTAGHTLTIEGNNVAGYQKNGITANDTNTTVAISDNSVVGAGPTTGAAQNAIQIAFGATGTISGNVVGDDVWAPDVFGDTGDAAAGILVYDAPGGVTVNSNTVSDNQYGIATVGDGTTANTSNTTIRSNLVSATHLYDGIDVCGSTNTVTTNNVRGSDESGIHIDGTCGTANNNSVSGNTVNAACAGILIGSAGSANIGTNAFYNVGTEVLTGSDQCPVATTSDIAGKANLGGKSGSPRFSPVK